MPRKRLDKKFQLSSYVSENNVSEEVLEMLDQELNEKNVNKSSLLREALEIYTQYKNNTLLFKLLKKHDLINEKVDLNSITGKESENKEGEFVQFDSLEKLKKGKIG